MYLAYPRESTFGLDVARRDPQGVRDRVTEVMGRPVIVHYLFVFVAPEQTLFGTGEQRRTIGTAWGLCLMFPVTAAAGALLGQAIP